MRLPNAMPLTWLAGVTLALPLYGLACSDYGVTLGQPTAELSTQAVDFGEVVVGRQETLSVMVKNVGDGPLVIQSAGLDGTTSADFSFAELSSDAIDKGQEAELLISYLPDMVGQDYGRVQLASNDPDTPIANIDLAGLGVEPEIVLDPDILWFGEVTTGDSSSLSVRVNSRGSGSLEISDISLSEGLEGEYGFMLPSTVSLPYAMPSGTSMDVVVTFSPESDGELNGELVFTTNDPGAGEASVTLLGNSDEDPTKSTPPQVEILVPAWGEHVLSDQEVAVTGTVTDEEDPPENLACLAYSGTALIGSASPDADGNVTIPGATLPIGDIAVTLRCVDTDGQTGEDIVDVVVWDVDEPIDYVLAPGTSPFAWWFVDDDVRIYLDGRLVFEDDNHHTDTHEPLTLEAEIGQEIRIEVTDYNHCDGVIDPLNLHFGTTEHQEGIAGFCASACSSHACYSPTYEGPWPGVVFEASFIISIP